MMKFRIGVAFGAIGILFLAFQNCGEGFSSGLGDFGSTGGPGGRTPTIVQIPQDLPNFTGLPTNNLMDLTYVNDVLYVASDAGLITTNATGQILSIITREQGLASNRVRSVAFELGILYVGTEAGLSVSTDNGASFINQGLDDGLPSEDIRFVRANQNVVYAGTSQGLAISRNSGASFTVQASIPPQPILNISVQDLFVNVSVANTGGFFSSLDAGVNFENILQPAEGTEGPGAIVVSEFFDDETWVLVAASREDSVYLRNRLNPDVYNRRPSTGLTGAPAVQFRALHLENGVLYGATTTGEFAISPNQTYANLWNIVGEAEGLMNSFVNRIEVEGANVFLATEGGLAVSNDSGVSFSMVSTFTGLRTQDVRSVDAAGPEVYVTYDKSWIGLSGDSGRSFGNYSFLSDQEQSINNLYVTEGRILAATTEGLWESLDMGTTFLLVPALNLGNISYVTASGNQILAADAGGLYKSADNGVTFEYVENGNMGGASSGIRQIVIAGTVIHLVTAAGLETSTDGGLSFIPNTQLSLPLGSSVEKALDTGAIIYVLGSGGEFYISEDRGLSFQQIDLSPYIGGGQVYDIELLGTYLYIGSDNGVLVSNNGGQSFGRYYLPGIPQNTKITSLSSGGGQVYLGTERGLFRLSW